MVNTYSWYSLPQNIKNKIQPVKQFLSAEAQNISWYNLPNKVQLIINELSEQDLNCKPVGKVTWYNLPKNLEVLDILIDCI